LKLIDFGLSKRFQPGDYHATKAGTPNYIAPEVLNGRYDEKVDVWSMGVICYMMLSGRQPFGGKNVNIVLKAVKIANVVMEQQYWKSISNEAKGLVKACLQKAPSVRLSAALALGHDWFRIVDSTAGDPGEPMAKLALGGLKAFGRMNQLKRATCTVIASQLSHGQIEQLKAMFMAMDGNGDGTLTAAEINEGLKRMDLKLPMDLNELLEEVDTDGSGVIDYTEFLAATMDKKLYMQEQVVWNAFNKFDLDGSGAIDVKELAKVIGEEEVCTAMHVNGQQDKLMETFLEVDTNGDGNIDFQKSFAMMRAAEDGNAPVARCTVQAPKESSSESRKSSPGRNSSPSAAGKKGRTRSRSESAAGDGRATIGLAKTGWEFQKEEPDA